MAKEVLIIEVRADGTRVVKQNLKGVGTEAQRASKGVDLLKRALLFIGVAESIRRVTGTLASFSQELSTVRAISGANEQQFNALRARAEELGAATRFSATQAAEGLTNLARSGFTVAESIDTVDDTLKLAQAGALDLGTAAQITAGTLRGFRLETSEAGRVVDVLALAANSANTDVTELGEALKFVAPVAAGTGVSIEETVAAINALSDANLRGTLAGTGLRKVIGTLEKGAPALTKQLKALGLTADDVRVSEVGLATALERLRDAGVDAGDALALFGDRGGPAFEILVNAIPQVREATDRLGEAGGTADRVAQIMDDNLNGALLRVRSALEAVVLSFGKIGAESFLTDFFNGLAGAIRFVAQNSEVLEGILAGVAAVTLPLVVKGVLALTAAIAANPIGLLATALAGVIGLLTTFRDDIVVSADGVTTLGDVGRAVFEELGNLFAILSQAAQEALTIVVQAWNGVFSDDLPATFEGFVRLVARGVDTVIGVFSALGAVIVTAIDAPLDTLGFLFVEAVNFIIRAMNTLTRTVSRQLRALVENLIQIAARIPGVGQEIADRLAQIRVELPELSELEQPFEQQGEALGNAFAEGFKKSTQASDLVDRTFARAQQIGEERRAGLGEGDRDTIGDDTQAIKDLNNEIDKTPDKLNAAKTAGESFVKTLKDGVIGAEEFGAALGGIALSAVDQLSGAIADLAISGFRDFESFKDALSGILRSIAKEIIKLIIQTLILKAINAALGGEGGGGGGGGGGAGGGIGGLVVNTSVAAATRQTGGPLVGGQVAIVGERGPELFQAPTGGGRIVPNDQLMQMQSAPPQVTVINVSDENAALSALDTAEGDEVILNSLQKNPERARAIIGVS